MSGETPGRTTIKWLNIGEHHAVVCWPPIVLRSFRGARTEQSARSRLILTAITLTGCGLLAGDPTLRSATPPTCVTSPTFRNYISTQVAGKFPAEFGGFAAAFEGVFPRCQDRSPWSSPHHTWLSPRLTCLPMHHATITWGPETVTLQNQLRDPPNSSNSMGAFDCATLTMAPRGPGGTVPLDFLTATALSDLHLVTMVGALSCDNGLRWLGNR